MDTEKTYLGWIRQFVGFHQGRKPSTMDASHVRDFLKHLAMDRQVASSTQNQALHAVVFLFKSVLKKDIGDSAGGRAGYPHGPGFIGAFASGDDIHARAQPGADGRDKSRGYAVSQARAPTGTTDRDADKDRLLQLFQIVREAPTDEPAAASNTLVSKIVMA